LNNRAAQLQSGGDGQKPAALYLRALAILEAACGPDDSDIAVTLSNLGLFYKATGRFAEARPFYDRALTILERTVGPAHPQVATVLHNLAALLRAQADALEARGERLAAEAAEVRDPRVRAQARIRKERTRFALEARPSRIHRFGIFAAQDLPAKAALIEYTGERVARREAVRRWSANRTYLLKLDDHWRLDGSVGGSGAEFINHSCEPNCRFRVGAKDVWIVSLRPIRAGEELVVDYAFPRDSPRIECHCGSPGCRGTINAGS
jgi:tetratricopeptide (TPR) repeat protein